jgi:hypothetical protein
MFATILNEVSGYFDRRVLLSTFLPTLAFATAAVVSALVALRGVHAVVTFWQSKPASEQVFVIAGFLALVTLWSLVLTNLRPAVDRLFQGHWPAGRRLGVMDDRLRGRYRRERARLTDADDGLEQIEAVVVQALDALPRQAAVAAVQTGAGPAAQVDAAGPVDAGLATLETALAPRSPRPKAGGLSLGEAERLLTLSAQLADVATLLAPEAGRMADPEWGGRLARFTRAATELEMRLRMVLQAVRTQRGGLQQKLFLWYPTEPVDALPTRLGNILMAAEQYPRIRYQLDPVVIWSRLQPLMPSSYLSLLKDAKASMDLMLTLAMYLIIFGLPAAVWAAVQAPLTATLAWVAVAAASITGLVLLTVISGAKGRVIGLVVTIALLTPPALIIALRPSGPAGLNGAISRADFLVALGAGIAAVALGCYATACQAGLVYAEQLRSAFDLHRQLVLRALGLVLPQDLGAEGKLWRDITSFLYRGDIPSPTTFVYDLSTPQDISATIKMSTPSV